MTPPLHLTRARCEHFHVANQDRGPLPFGMVARPGSERVMSRSLKRLEKRVADLKEEVADDHPAKAAPLTALEFLACVRTLCGAQVREAPPRAAAAGAALLRSRAHVSALMSAAR